MSLRLTIVLGFCLLLAGLSQVVVAQDDDGRVAAPAPPPPSVPQAMPVAAPAAPGQDEFAPGPMTPGEIPASAPVTATIEPGEMVIPSNKPIITKPNEKVVPTGATISEMQSQSRVLEDERPERVQVFPEDPESAWWEINPHYAFDRAQREQRPLMLLFTGIWNTQAMALSQEVFATKSFNNFVKENLVICYLNYPRNYTDAPDALRKIKDRFKVKGYPNVLIFNPNGEVERGIRGYRSGRPVDYFNELVGACRPVIESVRLQKAELIARGYRDWSNYLGKEIFARFVKHDGVRVVIQDASGQKWTIPLNDLAPEDQKMVESFPKVDKLDSE
jgi:hypothetical protein